MTKQDRRTFLAAAAATAALGTAAPAFGKGRAMFFKRIGRPIGLQVYTLGDEPKKDLEAVFAQIARIGYRDLELPGLWGLIPTRIKEAAVKVGLDISSVHVPSGSYSPANEATLSGESTRLIDELSVLGAKQAVLPIVPFPQGFRPNGMDTFGQDLVAAISAIGPDHWKRSAELLNEKGAVLKKAGIALGYHDHNIEFAPVGKETGWEILARETDPALVHFEVDIGWVAAAGLDPVAFLNRYKGRVRQLHVKDVQASTKANFNVRMDPTQVGSGKMDWATVLPAAYRAGVRNFYVEQEPPFTISRMEAAARSYAYLAALKA